jgi:hypothetical protein
MKEVKVKLFLNNKVRFPEALKELFSLGFKVQTVKEDSMQVTGFILPEHSKTLVNLPFVNFAIKMPDLSA